MKLFAAILLGLSAVGPVWPNAASAAPAQQEPAGKKFDARGIVQSVAADHKTASIAHEKIPGFMPAMTMPFEAPNPALLADVHAGDHVAFTFVAPGDGRLVLVSIAKEAAH